MRADELFPRGGGLPFWRGWDPMPLQNVAHRLGTDRQAQVGEGADDPVIAPGAILPGHADDQRLQLRVDPGATGSLALLGAVELLGHELPVPAENRVGLDNRRDFLQSLLAKPVAKLREGFAFAVAQPDAPCE